MASSKFLFEAVCHVLVGTYETTSNENDMDDTDIMMMLEDVTDLAIDNDTTTRSGESGSGEDEITVIMEIQNRGTAIVRLMYICIDTLLYVSRIGNMRLIADTLDMLHLAS